MNIYNFILTKVAFEVGRPLAMWQIAWARFRTTSPVPLNLPEWP